jgi:hypothetical protein
MMGDTRNHNSRQPCHAPSLPAAPHKVNGNPQRLVQRNFVSI